MLHKDLNRLLSVLHNMQQLVVETPSAIQRVSKHLQSEKVWCLYLTQDSPSIRWIRILTLMSHHAGIQGPYLFFLW